MSVPTTVSETAITLKYGWQLRDIPHSEQTPALVKHAIQLDGMALEYAAPHLKTEELCFVAVQKIGLALEFVPEELQTPKICKTAIETNSGAVRWVCLSKLTDEICALGFQKTQSIQHWIPNHLQTSKFWRTVLKNTDDFIAGKLWYYVWYINAESWDKKLT